MPKLGFGLMRLPRLEDGKTIDVEQVKVMTDAFLDAGMRYFDTAFVYEGSEEACRKALVERHPRESYYLATKLNAGMPGLTEETAKQEFFTSLERTGAQYFDFYLLHAIGKRNLPNYNDWGIWEFAQEQKAKGLIKHVGFSFHDTPELLEEVLTAHPEAEFVQLQINYADWNNPSVQSRRCYEVARKFNKPVVVMEPIKGGMLAVPPVPVKEVLQAANPDVSCASWAVRYVASKEGILVVLSGMSNVEQMEDNLSYMKNFQPLSEEEAAVVAKAQAALEAIPSIPCTGCRYCVAGCPMQINIPSIFSAMNHKLIYDNDERAKSGYANATRGDNGKASSCIKCGACEAQCPQHLQIRDLLEQAAEMFGE
ncbi:MAG: aldo/keto reductase [Solobacterium sp.]|nr:aldo/keto reductase [Solobacterium sp.]